MLFKILNLIVVIRRLDHINLELIKLLDFFSLQIKEENLIFNKSREIYSPSQFIKKIIYRNSKIINLINKELANYPIKKIIFAKEVYELLNKYNFIFKNFTLVTEKNTKYLSFINFYYELNKTEYQIECWAEKLILQDIITTCNYNEVDKIFWYILKNYFELDPIRIKNIRLEDLDFIINKNRA